MKMVPNRKQLRREYLWKKGKAYSELTFKGLASVLFGLFALFCMVEAVANFSLTYDDLGPALAGYIYLGSAALSIVAACLCLYDVPKAHKAARLPYVPPVTASTLPAEEILVRGAEEPQAPNETLLRATVKEEDMKAEELLRSSETDQRADRSRQ